MRYLLTGSILYTSAAARTTAVTAINTALAAFPQLASTATKYTAGLTQTQTSTLTFSFTCQDQDVAMALNEALRTAYSAGARTSGHISIAAVP